MIFPDTQKLRVANKYRLLCKCASLKKASQPIFNTTKNGLALKCAEKHIAA